MNSGQRTIALLQGAKKIKIAMGALILVLLFPPSNTAAEVFFYRDGQTVIGNIKKDLAQNGDSLIEMARRFDLGYNEIVDANPGLDPFVPGENADVVLPTSWILPNVASHRGIVVNISEMRIYYFYQRGKSKLVDTFPIGIGSEGTETPVGQFKVIQKITNPNWYPPESIRKENPELPRVVPAGPDNPLGTHALRLSLGSVLIHGTNRPFAVGRKASHGCIRMYPEDIPELYDKVPSGVNVTIVRQPVKVGVRGKRVYVEVHRDGKRSRRDYLAEAVRLLTDKGILKKVNTEKLYQALRDKRGIPVDISD
jgi:L,D-transpeptidase ErfK/SrfK